jgi:hypothetical protein
MELLKENSGGFQDYFQNFFEDQDWILKMPMGRQPCSSNRRKLLSNQQNIQ